LSKLPPQNHPDLLIGADQADDCGVLRLSEDKAVILTVDFFPAIVDDPYLFGQVAAANAMSDIFAMGGVPVSALNIIGFPEGELPVEALELLMRGGADKVNEAGAVIVGGHTLTDSELRYGLSVMGTVHPDAIVRTSGARAGDVLVLTKPLGTGIYSTAMKSGELSDKQSELFISTMTELNSAAARAMAAFGANACTDVTGFGLAGHALEMAEGSHVTIAIDMESVPLLPDALIMASRGLLTGGGMANIEFTSRSLEVRGELEREQKMLLHDPQTSGGLLVSIPSGNADEFLSELVSSGVEGAAVIGEVLDKSEKSLLVRT
jgi:selenide,water dikinase